MKTRVLAVLACLALVLMGSCEYLGWDIYPADLQNINANLDLPDLVYAKTGYSLDRVLGTAVVRLDPGSASHLMVLCSLQGSGLNNQVLFLNPDSLAFESIVSDPNASLPLTRIWDTSYVSMYCAGNTRIQPNLSLDATPASTTGATGIVPSPATSQNFAVISSGGMVILYVFDSSWTSIENPSLAVFSGNSVIRLVAVYADDSSTVVRLLFHDPSGTGYLLSFASPADLYAAVKNLTLAPDLASSSYVASVVPIPSMSEAATITKDGVVSRVWNKDGQLVRYGLLSGGILDSRAFQNEDLEGLSFSPDGSHWYYYDKARKLLLSLRTWW